MATIPSGVPSGSIQGAAPADVSWVYRWAANRLRFERWLLAAENRMDEGEADHVPPAKPMSA